MDKEVKKEFNAIGRQVVKEAKGKLIVGSKGRSKVATRELLNSISYELTETGIIFSYAEHGKYVEGGRRPGSTPPPVKPIERWIKQKGIAQWEDKNGKKISERSQAYMIARSIGRKGIKPLAFFTDPFMKAVKQMPELLGDAYTEVLNRRVKTILEAK